MSYTRQLFKSGDTLYATALNAMDNQIAVNTEALADNARLDIKVSGL